MWTKIKEWFKKYFHWIVIPITVIISFICGRKSLHATHADIERLRNSLAELTEQLQEARRTIDDLRAIERLKDTEYNKLRGLIEADRLEIDRAREQVEEGRTDLDTLEQANKRLRELIEQHRKELENL